VHFVGFHLLGPHGEVMNNIGVADPTTMYIYSLGHFLTTKGALIDGDVTPPLPPLKWVKKGSKIDQKLMKMEVKNHSKIMILNVKINFSTKIDIIDMKNSEKSSKLDHQMRC